MYDTSVLVALSLAQAGPAVGVLNYGILASFLVVVGAFLKYLTHRDKENRELSKDIASQMSDSMDRSTTQMDAFERRNATEHARIVEILATHFRTVPPE